MLYKYNCMKYYNKSSIIMPKNIKILLLKRWNALFNKTEWNDIKRNVTWTLNSVHEKIRFEM